MPNFPSSLDTYTPVSGTTLLAPVHAGMHNNDGSAIIQIESKLGIGAGSPTSNLLLVGAGNGTSSWLQTWNSGTLGTAIINNSTLGTPSITGGTVNLALVGTSQITGGTATNQTNNNGTFGTPSIIGLVNGIGTSSPITFGVSIVPIVGTLSDSPSGTFTPNAQAAQIYEITLGTNAVNRTFGTPTNLVDGQFLGYRVKQNAAAVGTILFNPLYRFPSGGTPALGTASTWTYIGFRYRAADSKLDYQGASTGLI